MLLQTNPYNRRQFLERSMLGFGSAFVLPSLLTSCTDHQITPGDPTTPIILPPYGAVEINWNAAAKLAVQTGLEAIPVVGEVLGPLVDIFWPKDKTDVWKQVRDQVEMLINQKIEDTAYNQVAGFLGSWDSKSDQATGLIGAITLFQQENNVFSLDQLKYRANQSNPAPDPTALIAQFKATNTAFTTFNQDFKQSASGYEVVLLPLFTQFANLHLALLREMVVFGQDWGRSSDQQTLIDLPALQNAITDYTNYVTSTYKIGAITGLLVKRNDQLNEPFKTANTYIRGMTLLALDYSDTWAYFDPTLYPNGAKNSDGTPIAMITREIYSDPFGTSNYSTNKDPITLPSAPPTQLPSNLTVWDGPRITAVQVKYPANGGPNGVDETPRMGDQKLGSAYAIPILPNNPITKVLVLTGIYRGTYFEDYLPSGLQFQFNDGTSTPLIDSTGGNLGPLVSSPLFGYDNNALSSVYIHGVNTELGGADCVVFGFKNWQAPLSTLNAIREIYVKSPNEVSIADFTRAFPKRAIPASLITDELKVARKAHWEWVKAHAKK